MSDRNDREAELTAILRTESGKGAARRTRKKGLLPAVVYGKGEQATSVTLVPGEFVKALMKPWRRNVLIHLDVQDSSGKSQGKKHVMMRELQKHPVRREPMHADFVEVDLDGSVEIRVPFRPIGRSSAVAMGGQVRTPLPALRVRTKPTTIPECIEFDTTPLDYGLTRASEITMPEGVELLEDGHQTVLTISRPRGADTEAEGEGEGEGEAAVEGAAEAPAAG